MKNEKYYQVAIILFLIVIVGLVVTLVMFNRGSEERESAMKDAVSKAAEANKAKGELTQQVMTLKNIIGHKDEASMDEIQKAHNDAMMRFAKNVNPEAQNYITALKNLGNELARKNDENKKAIDDLEEMRTNFQNLTALYQTVVKQAEEAKQKAVSDRMKDQKDFESNLATQREKFESLEVEKRRTEEEAQAQVKAATSKAEEADIRANQIKHRNDELAETLDGLRRTNFERPDGKILSVNQQTGLVVVNLGSEDGLMTRMTFSVYSPSITGISFGIDDPEREAVICEVCKREQSLNASKASIEITRITGPHQAEARILDDLLTDPIVANDVIYTPVWKPGQRQHFALGAGMRIPGVGKRDGMEGQSDLPEIIRLIKANGGVVDSYISEGTEEHPRGEIVGNITRDTSFIVIGDLSDEDNQDQEMMEAQAQMVQTSEQYAVRKIGLRELLSRMGWKNVTPVRGFGGLATDSDLRIVPTGAHRPSTGIVSPIYQGRNIEARIGTGDRTGRSSTGGVSGLYSDTPTQSQSHGQTSELFRPRKPATSKAELE